MIVIEKCEKRPGIFVGARNYRLVLDEEGLFVLELGKAMGHHKEGNIIADKILEKIKEKREKQQADKVQELNSSDLKQIVDNKKYFLIKKTDVKTVKVSDQNGLPKMQLKSLPLNITLHFWPGDKWKVEKLYEYLNK